MAEKEAIVFNVKHSNRSIVCLSLLAGAVLIPATSFADEIHVNRGQWESLSEEQREEIISTLKAAKDLSSEDTVVADDSVAATSDASSPTADNSTACKAACAAEAAIGAASCRKMPIAKMKWACGAVVTIKYGICMAGC